MSVIVADAGLGASITYEDCDAWDIAKRFCTTKTKECPSPTDVVKDNKCVPAGPTFCPPGQVPNPQWATIPTDAKAQAAAAGITACMPDPAKKARARCKVSVGARAYKCDQGDFQRAMSRAKRLGLRTGRPARVTIHVGPGRDLTFRPWTGQMGPAQPQAQPGGGYQCPPNTYPTQGPRGPVCAPLPTPSAAYAAQAAAQQQIGPGVRASRRLRRRGFHDGLGGAFACASPEAIEHVWARERAVRCRTPDGALAPCPLGVPPRTPISWAQFHSTQLGDAPGASPAQLPQRVFDAARCNAQDYLAAAQEVINLLNLYTQLGAPRTWSQRVLGLAQTFKSYRDKMAVTPPLPNIGSYCIESIKLGALARRYAEEMTKGTSVALPPPTIAPHAGSVKRRIEVEVERQAAGAIEDPTAQILGWVAIGLISAGALTGVVMLAKGKARRR
jgi:hypothetical protein